MCSRIKKFFGCYNEELVSGIKYENYSQCYNAIRNGADVNHYNSYGYFPLFYAAGVFSNYDITRLLLLSGADVNQRVNLERYGKKSNSSIEIASDPKICQLLIDFGANTDCKSLFFSFQVFNNTDKDIEKDKVFVKNCSDGIDIKTFKTAIQYRSRRDAEFYRLSLKSLKKRYGGKTAEYNEAVRELFNLAIDVKDFTFIGVLSNAGMITV
jgi:hypothetical protein